MASLIMRGAAGATLLACGVGNMISTNATPSSWVVAAAAVWLTFVTCASQGEVRQAWASVFWGLASTIAFATFLQTDRSFKGWADIYYFCSSAQEPLVYCSCDLSWSWSGYRKFLIIWNFVLSVALGVQKLVVTFLLDGLLPGEEMVTKESFMSVCWRLIPYWLNNWENDWGAECSSALFELPHFAVELLVVLPTVQILCSRLRVLVLPQLRVVVPEGNLNVEDLPREQLAPNIMRGFWQVDPLQTSVWGRLRANKRVMLIMVAVAFLAAVNAALVPAAMEAAVLAHPRSITLASMPLGLGPLNESLDAMQRNFLHLSCASRHAIRRGMQKHASELQKMANPGHVQNLPLIEIALAIMRLSCEKFFVLASVFCAFLIFREPPQWVRHVISTVAKVSDAFQTSILMTFPALCWYYNAGIIFSTFVTIVLWTGPMVRFMEKLRVNVASVRPVSLTASTLADIERMDGKCAICWSDFPGEGGGVADVWAPQSLPCTHAFHRPCIVQWLRQCHRQGRNPTCPMCSSTVELSVQWRLPWSDVGPDGGDVPMGAADEEGPDPQPMPNGAAAPLGGAVGMFPEIQAIIEDMDDLGAAHAAAVGNGGGGNEFAGNMPPPVHQPLLHAAAVAEEQPLHMPQLRQPQQQQQNGEQGLQYAGVQVVRRFLGMTRRAPPPADVDDLEQHATSASTEASHQTAASSCEGASSEHGVESRPAQYSSADGRGCSGSSFSGIDGSAGPSVPADSAAWRGPSDSATSSDRRPHAGGRRGHLQGSLPLPANTLRQQQQARGQQQWQRQLSSGVSFGSDGSHGLSTDIDLSASANAAEGGTASSGVRGSLRRRLAVHWNSSSSEPLPPRSD